MFRIDIKPLSVNEAYRGRRFSTDALEQYKKDLFYLLPKVRIPPGRLSVEYEFGISQAADGDNFIKAFQDAIANKYQFNDKKIYEWHVKKVDVRPGNEYVEFIIEALDNEAAARYDD
ncbi:MAG: hypothetical protein PHI63_06670 [Patescibacteria group bacterium]|nr:hypothetical protein [Patescibacteria group bacterium]